MSWAAASAPARYVVGLAMAVGGAVVGYGIHALMPGVQPGTVAVAAGAICTNLGWIPEAARPGLKVASTQILRIAVVLLGLSLSLSQVVELGGPGLLVVVATVAVSFFGTIGLARLLRLPAGTGLLVATGFSICGASAIAAMQPVARAKKDDTAVALALVTLCGTLSIVVLPLLRLPLGLDDPAVFGQWVGAAVHDVGQVVATANTTPGALQSAVIVKLTRVMLLAPLVLLTGLVLARRYRGEALPEGAKRPALLPVFVAGFIAAIVLNSVVALPAPVLTIAHRGQEMLLAVALFALGTGIHREVLRRAGGRALALGGLSSLVVAGTALLGVRLITR